MKRLKTSDEVSDISFEHFKSCCNVCLKSVCECILVSRFFPSFFKMENRGDVKL